MNNLSKYKPGCLLPRLFQNAKSNLLMKLYVEGKIILALCFFEEEFHTFLTSPDIHWNDVRTNR